LLSSTTPLHLCHPIPPGFSSAILACPQLDPYAALEALWPLLAPSATFVVFSPWLSPLAEAMQRLTTSKRAVMLALQESWLRAYQVRVAEGLPGEDCLEVFAGFGDKDARKG
jgi:tRNA (adenine-N(1)-)-methyltransferase non-catalytic subunit